MFKSGESNVLFHPDLRVFGSGKSNTSLHTERNQEKERERKKDRRKKERKKKERRGWGRK